METSLYNKLPVYRSAGDVIEEIVKAAKLSLTLGGGSPKGWSQTGTFERCPQAYFLRYVRQIEVPDERPARAVGSFFHAFLALRETLRGHLSGYRTGFGPFNLYSALVARPDVNPEALNESWRVFRAYEAYYAKDPSIPLAVEHTVIDPVTGNSCRYDAIVRLPDGAVVGVPGGTYIEEHKTAGAFTEDAVTGWDLDGEVVGEYTLWTRVPQLARAFGPLQGVIINLAGKQKTPQFTRTYVVPQKELAKRHLKVLEHIDSRIEECRAEKYWPRYMNGCITRYGRCDYYNMCRG